MNPVTRRGALSLIPAAVASVAAPAAALAANDVSPELGRLIRDHDALVAAYSAAAKVIDDFLDTHPWKPWRTVEEKHEAIRLDQIAAGKLSACYPAFDAVLGYPCRTLADVRAKVPVLTSSPAGASDFHFEPSEMEAFLASLMGETPCAAS